MGKPPLIHVPGSLSPNTQVVEEPPFRRGVQLVELKDGLIHLGYAEYPDSPFREPISVQQLFRSWREAQIYLTLWDTLKYVQWW